MPNWNASCAGFAPTLRRQAPREGVVLTLTLTSRSMKVGWAEHIAGAFARCGVGGVGTSRPAEAEKRSVVINPTQLV